MLLFNLLISFWMTLGSVCWKQKIPENTFSFVDLILLPWPLNFSMAILTGLFVVGADVSYPLISRFLKTFSKNWLKSSDTSLSFAINLLFSTTVILDLLVTLSVRNGLKNFQHVCCLLYIWWLCYYNTSFVIWLADKILVHNSRTRILPDMELVVKYQ